MSPVLFLFVTQAFKDTLKLNARPASFSHFPENKNGNVGTTRGRLLSQNTSAKDITFIFQSSFYVENSFFVFQNRDELTDAIGVLKAHLSRFGLTMHVGSNNTRSKSEAMFFLAPYKMQRHKLNCQKT
jgi:hypothetical protein